MILAALAALCALAAITGAVVGAADLSKEYGISRERMRLIGVRAFEKLQRAIKAQAMEQRLGTA